MATHYSTLGVPKGADITAIRQAYRKLARQYHPDLNPGDDTSAAKFKEINEAYEVLSDATTRQKYDKYGDQWKHAEQYEGRADAGSPFRRYTTRSGPEGFNFDFYGGVGDPFGGLGGSAGRAAAVVRLETNVELSLEEAYHGTRRTLGLSGPDGRRRIEVTIPPGVDTGSTVSVKPAQGQELHVETTVLPNDRFKRRGADLYTDVKVSMFDALLGGETVVDTIAGPVTLKVPEGSQNGQRVRLSGRGMPLLRNPKKKGDLFVTLRPQLPKDLTGEQRDLVEKLQELSES